MTIGTTFDSNLTRDQLCATALRKLAVLKGGSAPSSSQLNNAVEALNLIIRKEDVRGTKESRDLWAMDTKTLKLTAGGYVYSTVEGLNGGILDLTGCVYRDTAGSDTPMKIITREQYDVLEDKNEVGTPECVFLTIDRALGSRLLYPWPMVSTVGTTSEVLGTEGTPLNYRCIMGHTSTTDSRPITGINWRLYWEQAGSAGAAWATSTAYTNGELLRYTFRRPLSDFDAAGDNPDMPQSWTDYLVWRLAYALAPEYTIDLETRAEIRTRYLEAYEELYPTKMAEQSADGWHNKASFM